MCISVLDFVWVGQMKFLSAELGGTFVTAFTALFGILWGDMGRGAGGGVDAGTPKFFFLANSGWWVRFAGNFDVCRTVRGQSSLAGQEYQVAYPMKVGFAQGIILPGLFSWRRGGRDSLEGD